MLTQIKKAEHSVEFATAERCHISEIANDNGDELISIARARVEPGITTAWHSLKDTSERYIIVSGQGRVEVDELPPTDVVPGDVVRIAPDKRQRISNTGRQDLVFFAICAPPFKADNYVNLESS